MTGSEDETREIRREFAARDRRPIRAWLARGYEILSTERLARMTEIVRRELPGVEQPAILDVGCGHGLDLAWWRRHGWPPDRLAGIDLVDARVAAARARNPDVDVRLGDGAALPYPAGSFDVVTASTVFSSILDPAMRRGLFAEMARALRPGGIVIVYDFVIRNPRNPRVVAMTGRRLAGIAGRPPDASWPVSPLLYAVGPAAMLHPALARLVGRAMPRTHRLSVWRA